MKLNWNFLGGERVQNKKPSVGEHGYFLELHIEVHNHKSFWYTSEELKRLLTNCVLCTVQLLDVA